MGVEPGVRVRRFPNPILDLWIPANGVFRATVQRISVSVYVQCYSTILEVTLEELGSLGYANSSMTVIRTFLLQRITISQFKTRDFVGLHLRTWHSTQISS